MVVSGGYRGHISDVLGIGAALRRAGFSVVVYGWRGTPGSDAAPHTLGANECRDLTAVLDAVRGRLGPLPIGLLGYSMGGAVSISVAADEMCIRDRVKPASAKASVRYGWSYWTQRTDDVVSGRITPISRLLAPLVA